MLFASRATLEPNGAGGFRLIEAFFRLPSSSTILLPCAACPRFACSRRSFRWSCPTRVGDLDPYWRRARRGGPADLHEVRTSGRLALIRDNQRKHAVTCSSALGASVARPYRRAPSRQLSPGRPRCASRLLGHGLLRGDRIGVDGYALILVDADVLAEPTRPAPTRAVTWLRRHERALDAGEGELQRSPRAPTACCDGASS